MVRTTILTGLTASIFWVAMAQSSRPSFQLASIKPAENVGGISIAPRRLGDRVTYVTEVRMIVYYAYHVAPYQVSGDLPDGIYDIQALAENSPSDNELRLMFQRLLEDRFGFKLHYESRPMRSYDLILAKGGPKLKPARNGGEELLDGTLAPEGVGAFVSRAGPRLVGRNATMAQLADSLARSLQNPVTDRTGIAGNFDFSVAFAKDSAGQDGAGLPRAPTLETAIQELGLKLQSGTAPVRILVIDHVTPPTEN